MNTIRFIFAGILFIFGVYLCIDLFVSGFSFIVLAVAIVAFILAHYVKPKKMPEDDWAGIWDILDLIIDMPFKALSAILRTANKGSKTDFDGIDF